jgi:small conductance mechanosensitive channel
VFGHGAGAAPEECVMRLVRIVALLGAPLWITVGSASGDVPPAAPSLRDPQAIEATLTSLRAAGHTRDSLAAVADTSRGTSREVLEERIWQIQIEGFAAIRSLADSIRDERNRGRDVSAATRVVSEAVREHWPGYLAQLQRGQAKLEELRGDYDAASGSQRLAIGAAMSRQSDRLLESYQSLADALLALGRVDVDVSTEREYLAHRLPEAANGLVTRLGLARREESMARLRVSRDPTNADLRFASEAAQEGVGRVTHGLQTSILIMSQLGLETTDLRVALIANTGRITADVLQWKVLLGVVRYLWGGLMVFLAARSAGWLLRGFLILLTFMAFRALSKLVGRIVRTTIRYSSLSALMRAAIVRYSAHAVMAVGILVILRQLGFQLAPLLAGLGIVGVVVGFAMQNTLANLAAGAMILGNQPFDVGDEIEVAGVLGIVKHLSLVSTTILTFDNQTIIIPNSAVWGGVIRNRTAEPMRRVDLSFGVSYGDDIEKAERVLGEIVSGVADVLREPAPVVKLHQLADSSVNFVVRAWTTRERYWDVYWALTREVKLRFDREGISIPFPQRELHVNMMASAGEDEAAPRPGRRDS